MMSLARNLLMALVLAVAWVPAAGAETPQTDASFVQMMKGGDGEKLEALSLYYDLHVLEIEVQLATERNTGAFLGARRAKSEGNEAEAARLDAMFEATKAERTGKIEQNRALRVRLGEVSGVDFSEALIAAPDVPDEMPPMPAGASTEQEKSRQQAWEQVVAARSEMDVARISLLEGQEKYGQGIGGVRIGDLMRAVSAAEAAMARAAGNYRLIVARIAVGAGRDLAETLSGI